uniref:Uncharacterized protein n=1 Tax=Arundo donax TaxID=35708 RepID=A0A0A9GJX5_ARUDO
MHRLVTVVLRSETDLEPPCGCRFGQSLDEWAPTILVRPCYVGQPADLVRFLCAMHALLRLTAP